MRRRLSTLVFRDISVCCFRFLWMVAIYFEELLSVLFSFFFPFSFISLSSFLLTSLRHTHIHYVDRSWRGQLGMQATQFPKPLLSLFLGQSLTLGSQSVNAYKYRPVSCDLTHPCHRLSNRAGSSHLRWSVRQLRASPPRSFPTRHFATSRVTRTTAVWFSASNCIPAQLVYPITSIAAQLDLPMRTDDIAFKVLICRRHSPSRP